MPDDELEREALRTLDPALQCGLSEAQRDKLARAIVAAWSGSFPLVDDGPSDSAVHFIASGGGR